MGVVETVKFAISVGEVLQIVTQLREAKQEIEAANKDIQQAYGDIKSVSSGDFIDVLIQRAEALAERMTKLTMSFEDVISGISNAIDLIRQTDGGGAQNAASRMSGY